MGDIWREIKGKFKGRRLSEKSRKRLAIETLLSCLISILFLAFFNVILESTTESVLWLIVGVIVLAFGFWCVRVIGNVFIGTSLLIIGSDIAGVMIVILF